MAEHSSLARSEPFGRREDPFCGAPTRRLETLERIEPLAGHAHPEWHVGAPIRIDGQRVSGVDQLSRRRRVQCSEEPADVHSEASSVGVREICVCQLAAWKEPVAKKRSREARALRPDECRNRDRDREKLAQPE